MFTKASQQSAMVDIGVHRLRRSARARFSNNNNNKENRRAPTSRVAFLLHTDLVRPCVWYVCVARGSPFSGAIAHRPDKSWRTDPAGAIAGERKRPSGPCHETQDELEGKFPEKGCSDAAHWKSSHRFADERWR
ncbi:hypothetical protein MRX96_055933 [Rhipicephalus microplus]